MHCGVKPNCKITAASALIGFWQAGARRGEVGAGRAGERGPVQDLQHRALAREAQLQL